MAVHVGERRKAGQWWQITWPKVFSHECDKRPIPCLKRDWSSVAKVISVLTMYDIYVIQQTYIGNIIWMTEDLTVPSINLAYCKTAEDYIYLYSHSFSIFCRQFIFLHALLPVSCSILFWVRNSVRECVRGLDLTCSCLLFMQYKQLDFYFIF